jgi:hypothetical protein
MAINETVKQYVALKEEIKFLSEREAELKKRLLTTVEELGQEDSKGHLVLEVEGITLTRQRKVSNPLDLEVAIPLLEEKNLKKQCTKTVEQIDQDEIIIAYSKGLLTDEEVESMFPKKITYAFLVK